MENQRVSVPLRGIVKDKPQLQSADGDCEEIINLRFIDNAWRGVGAKDRLPYSIVSTKIYSKLISPYILPDGTFVGFCSSDNSVYLIVTDGDNESNEQLLVTLGSGDVFKSFAWMNNTVLVYSEQNITALQYLPDATGISDMFILLGDLEMPRIAIGEKDELQEVIFQGSVTNLQENISTVSQSYFDGMRGKFFNLYNEKRTNGWFMGNVSFFFAYKLFDGSYIKHSGPFIWNVGWDKANYPMVYRHFHEDTPDPPPNPNPIPYGLSAWSMVVSLGRPTIYYEYKPDNIVLDAYNKAGLIRSLCVFMSPEKSGYDIFNADIEDWTLSIGPTIYYTAPFNSEAFKGLPDVANHFLVNEIPIDDLLESISIGGVKRIPVILDRNQLASIETNENLPIDNFSSHKLIPNAHYLYNSRLHLGDVSILPGPMQSPFIDWFYDASEEEYITPAERDNSLFNDYFGEGFTIVEDNTGILAGLNFFLHVEIISDRKTYQKTSPILSSDLRVFSKVNIDPVIDYYVCVRPLSAYPDLRAKKWMLLVKKDSDTHLKICEAGADVGLGVFDLRLRTFSNTAIYNGNMQEFDNETYKPIWLKLPVSPSDYNKLINYDSPLTYTHDWQEPNRIQVSEVNNLFLYPAKQSYRVGNPDYTIRAMIVAQEPLTEMQFGQFPLYTFTAGGVYALEYGGGGEVLYSRITQFLTDVIREGAIPVALAGGAIVYQELSAVKVLIGREAKDISRPVIANSKNPLYLDAHLVNMTDNPELSELRAVLDDPASTMQMDDFILNSLIGYDHTRKEILFTGNGNYTLVYQLISGAWYKRTDMFDNYLHETGGHLGMVREVAGVTDVDIPKYGLLYNWYAAVDARNITSSDTWNVPSKTNWETLITYLGGSSVAGGKLKETGITYWSSPNEGATNEVGFNARGSGVRYPLGYYTFQKERISLWASTLIGTGPRAYDYTMFYDNTTIPSSYFNDPEFGLSIRLVRPATESEQLLPDGTACDPYTGNDGKIYRTVKIGTQVWLAANLSETKFRNGDYIHGFDGGVYTPISNEDWAALTTAALCAYDNDWSNAFTTEEETTFRTSFYKLSSEVETAEGEQSIMQKPWIFAQTRPFSLGQLSYKHIERIIARFMGVNFVVREIDHIEVEARYGALYNQWALIDAAEPEPALELTFDDIANVPVADASDVADWNTFFDLPTNGTPFTSVDVDMNMVRLLGGGNIFINGSIFYGNENPLISIVDNSGVITSVSDFCFASNWNITLIKLKALITAGISSFIECKILKELRLDALDSCGVACFGQLYDLETLYIPVVSDLGGTTGDDTVFFGLHTGENTNNITITVPAALMTCNSGNPDGDIQYLQANNTVTIITV